MSYKNSMKLFASNFSFVWKQLVYLLICLLLLAICSYTTIKPVIDILQANNIGAEFEALTKIFYDSPNEIAIKIRDIFESVVVIIANNFSKISISLFFAIILCLILPYLLVQMSVYNLSSIAYQKTTMNMNVHYVQNAMSTFKAGLKYAFSTLIFMLPFMAIEVVLFLFYISLAKSIFSALLGLMIFSALIIFIESIKLALFAHFTGLVISEPQNMFKAFGKSFGFVFKNFWKNISTSIILHLTIVFVNSFIMVFTFFAGLFVSIPATFVLIAFYYIVSYLNSAGQRYYLSDTIIYNPIKHVVKKDDFVTISIPEASSEIEVETTNMKKVYKKHKTNKD